MRISPIFAPMKVNIRTLDLEALKTWMVEHGEKPFRAKQVYEWLWKKSARDFEQMTSLSKSTRSLLSEHFSLPAVRISSSQKSGDGTIKNAFRLHDEFLVEGVLIPTPKRMTACISSQVGCSLTCKFCATARLKRERNIQADEIYDQVALIMEQAEKNYKKPLTNIVYMGMGEPLLNYQNVLTSVEKITSPEGLGMSPSRITVSTAGVAKMIKKLGDDKVRFRLALSLHAANDAKRNEIMPINESNSLEALAESLKHYHNQTGNPVTYEYIIFDGFNDTIKDAHELYEFCQHVPCKVNVIEYNPIDDGELQQAKPEKTDAFISYLEKKGIVVNVRRSRGKDIDAACGQLANKLK